MKSKLLKIGQAAEMIGVSVQTLRRWDKSGKLSAIRKTEGGYRYYKRKQIEKFIKNNTKDTFVLGRNWVVSEKAYKPLSSFYCQDSAVFQRELSRLEKNLKNNKETKDLFSLLTAITGEIGNNSFDHNWGSWPDIPGIFFAYDIDRNKIVLADRGVGVLNTLKKIKPELKTHREALQVAFTETISGRHPEYRGNGLKFVRKVVEKNEIELLFYTGNAVLELKEKSSKLIIKKTKDHIQGCLVLIKF